MFVLLWRFLFAFVTLGPTAAKGGSIVASIALPLLLLAIFGILFVLRSMAPRGMMKIGISMLQIVARYVDVCLLFSSG